MAVLTKPKTPIKTQRTNSSPITLLKVIRSTVATSVADTIQHTEQQNLIYFRLKTRIKQVISIWWTRTCYRNRSRTTLLTNLAGRDWPIRFVNNLPMHNNKWTAIITLVFKMRKWWFNIVFFKRIPHLYGCKSMKDSTIDIILKLWLLVLLEVHRAPFNHQIHDPAMSLSWPLLKNRHRELIPMNLNEPDKVSAGRRMDRELIYLA